MKCAEGIATLKNFIEKDRVYDFLARLNQEFDQFRVQILGKEEMPSLEEVISIILSEESQRAIMLEPQVSKGYALTIISKQMKALENGRVQPRAKLTKISNIRLDFQEEIIRTTETISGALIERC